MVTPPRTTRDDALTVITRPRAAAVSLLRLEPLETTP